MTGERVVTIELRCGDLPGARFAECDALRLGVQRGKEVVDDVPADRPHVTFTIPLRARLGTDDAVTFLGPYAHGSPSERFLYLSWGERLGESWRIIRRAKIRLEGLGRGIVEQALHADAPIVASISMRDARGEPVCGSIQSSRICWRVVPKDGAVDP